ncbi:MAG: DUF6456 domain-containing protein [Pseudomonadota bacterium]
MTEKLKPKKKKQVRPLPYQPPVEARTLKNADGVTQDVLLHVNESPLTWLRTHKDKDGAFMISDAQFVAGEKLRADFTRAQLMPRTTSSWDMSRAGCQRGLPISTDFSDGTLAAKQRVNEALQAVGPELSGILQDVCCFLKGLSLVEAERRWPARTAKIVLALALDRLAAHYGFATEAVGKNAGKIRNWGADDYRPQIQY